MAIITLTVNGTVNVSVQPGDSVYYCANTSSLGGFNTNINIDDVILMGTVTSTTSTTVVIDSGTLNYPMPSVGSFLLFSKDNAVNLTSLIGYYASTEFRNNSTEKIELFNVTLDTEESSK